MLQKIKKIKIRLIKLIIFSNNIVTRKIRRISIISTISGHHIRHVCSSKAFKHSNSIILKNINSLKITIK